MCNWVCFSSLSKVYDAAVRWLKYDEPNRQPYMVDILAKVRFPLISKNFLSKTVQAEPLIQDNPECLKMVISKFIPCGCFQPSISLRNYYSISRQVIANVDANQH